MTGMAIVIVVELALLYGVMHTRERSDFSESVAMLRRVKQLDAQWELDILNEKLGINMRADPASNPPTDLVDQWTRVQAVEASRNRDDSSAWIASAAAVSKALYEKAKLVEQFRFHNASLEIALNSFSTVEDRMRTSLREIKDTRRKQATKIATDVNAAVLGTMEYAHLASSERAGKVKGALDVLEGDADRLPIDLQSAVNILASSVRAVLREQPAVNATLNEIAAVPVAGRLDTLTDILTRAQLHDNARDRRSKLFLMMFSAILAGLLLYVGSRLVLSYGVINRANKALHQSNASLEHRVQQRTRELQEAQSTLVATARQAGMAEIATNVLHNVGNVLNSINISADLISHKVRASKSQGLDKAVQMINEHSADLGHFITRDAKGRLLPAYLNQLTEALQSEKKGIVDELVQLTKSVDHIKEIVATQQTYAGVSSILEPVQVTDLIEDALRMQLGTLALHQIKIVKEYSQIPVLLLDKHRLLLILVNLISNAGHAFSRAVERTREITLSVDITDNEELRVRVKDDGEGIAPENITRIFEHGFTTRRDGHGFGLHSCALAAMEMRGTLTARSDGPGKGAVFTLRVPLHLTGDEGSVTGTVIQERFASGVDGSVG